MQIITDTKEKIFIFSVFIGVCGWFIDAVFDALLLYEKPFLDILITDISLNEIYIRIFVCMCFFIFGYFIFKYLIQKKEAEEELRKTHNDLTKANKDLEKKVKERTAEVEKILKQKDEFIIKLGHDLKTPLTPLMGLLPMAAEKVQDDELKNFLELSIKNVHYIRDLVSKTIDFARLDSNLVEFTLEDAYLYPEIDKVIKNNKYLLKENDIYVENNINEEAFVKVDKLRLREVFQNIIKNAVRCTPECGGKITIDGLEDEGFIKISIKDTGVGMTKDELENVFDVLYKVDPSRNDLSSNGLGLPICKRIVEKHGGKIWIESPGIGKGTTVYFTVPSSKKIAKKKQEDSKES